MLVGLVCGVAAALSYGVASVLQAAAAEQSEASEHLDPRLLLRLLRTWRYVLGLTLDSAGFLLSLVALRVLPLYVVQSLVASSLAVAAVAAVLLLGTRISRWEALALVVVVLGLVLVGLSAAPESASPLGSTLAWLLLASAAVLGAAAVPLARLRGRWSAWALGGLAGLEFGVVAVAARALSSSATGTVPQVVRALLESPASYAVLVAAPAALAAYATALQRGSVVQATAPMVVGETVLPAIIGFALLGDHARPGWAVPAAAGFVLAVGAALALSRFGEVAPERAVTAP